MRLSRAAYDGRGDRADGQSVAAQVQSHFARLYGQSVETCPLDIEWKVEGPARELFFKQVRPYVQP